MKAHSDEILTAGRNKGAYRDFGPWIVKDNYVFYIKGINGSGELYDKGPYIKHPNLGIDISSGGRYFPGKLHDIYIEYDALSKILLAAGGTDVSDQIAGRRFVKDDDWYVDYLVHSLQNSNYFQAASLNFPYVYKDTRTVSSKGALHGTLHPMEHSGGFYEVVQIGAFLFHFTIRLWNYIGWYQSGVTDAETGIVHKAWYGGLHVGLGEDSNWLTEPDPNNTITQTNAVGADPVSYHYFHRFAITDCDGNVCYISSRAPRTIGHEIFPFSKTYIPPPEPLQGNPEAEAVFSYYSVKMRCLRTHTTLAFFSEHSGAGRQKFVIIAKANSDSNVFLLAYSTIPYTWRTGIQGSTINSAIDFVPNFAISGEDGRLLRSYNPQYNQAEITEFLKDDRFLVDITNGVYVNREGNILLNGTQYIANSFELSRSGYEYYYDAHFGIAVPLIFRLSDEKLVIFDEIYIGRLSNTGIFYQSHDVGLKIDIGTFVWLCSTESDEGMDTARRNLLLKTMDYPLEVPEQEPFEWISQLDADSERVVNSYFTWILSENRGVPSNWFELKVVANHGELSLFRVLDKTTINSNFNTFSLVGWDGSYEYVDKFEIVRQPSVDIRWVDSFRILFKRDERDSVPYLVRPYTSAAAITIPWIYDTTVRAFTASEMPDNTKAVEYTVMPGDIFVFATKYLNSGRENHCVFKLPNVLTETLKITPLVIENDLTYEYGTSGVSEFYLEQINGGWFVAGYRFAVSQSWTGGYETSLSRVTTGDILEIEKEVLPEPFWKLYYKDILVVENEGE